MKMDGACNAYLWKEVSIIAHRTVFTIQVPPTPASLLRLPKLL